MDHPSIGFIIEFLSYKGILRLSLGNDKVPPPYRHFNAPTCVAVLCYITQFLSNSEEHTSLTETIRRLNDSANNIKYFSPDSDIQHLYKIVVYDFMPQVEKFFTVPRKMSYHEDTLLNQIETLASFMDFLLQVLNSEANRYWEEEQSYAHLQTGNSEAFRSKEKRYALLHKALNFLLTFLGDMPFQCTQLEDAKILLDEYKIIANGVGSFIYYFVFSIDPVKSRNFTSCSDALLQKIEILNAKVKEYCIRFSELPVCVTQNVTSPIDSAFIVNSLLQDLESLINRGFQIDEMEDQIQTLYEELKSSRKFLKYPKIFREIEKETFKECSITVRDIAYEAEYFINSHVAGSIPFWYLRLRLPTVIHKLKLNGSRLQRIKISCEVLPVTKAISGTATRVAEGNLLGIEEIKTKILDDLIGNEKSLKIVSLIGMAGLGKTTLAKNLFDDSLVNHHFHRRVWCGISKRYDKRKVLFNTLTSLRCPSIDYIFSDSCDEELGKLTRQILERNTYLVVMDDVRDSSMWDDVKRYFPDDNNGSRIMFTSRTKDASPSESIFHKLPILGDVECLDLLVKKAFPNESYPPHLRYFGKRIAEKCHGVPLSVVLIAGVLANLDKHESVWEEVEIYSESFIFDPQADCRKVLEVSYEYLPDHLKLCYLYLGRFPPDTEIPVQKITQLWIAEGFIEREEEKSYEDVANEYLSDLINRSLVTVEERKYDGRVKTCGIYGPLHEMCVRKAEEENFLKCTENHFSMYERHHRLHVGCTPPALLGHFGLQCRSFSGHIPASSSNFPQMPLLRVMDLFPGGEYSNKLKEIDRAVHLRYLALSRTNHTFFWMRSLNLNTTTYQVISNLVKLEFLNVDTCDSQCDVPLVILKMEKLRHLKIKDRAKFKKDSGSFQTNNLNSLAYFCIDNLADVDTLKCCPLLHKLKCICSQSEFPDIRFLSELESLTMVFDFQCHVDKLTNMYIPSTIKKLNLTSIGLKQEAVEILGKLPNLEVLKLAKGGFMEEEWKTKEGEFQNLRFLKLDSYHVEQWITSSKHFPQLNYLVLRQCNMLKDIPRDLVKIATLKTVEVNECTFEATISAYQIEEE